MKPLVSFLSSVFTRRQSGFSAPIAPDAAFFVIGDIHGRLDLLQALISRIAAMTPEAKIVCVGDYVDRGEQSKGVLDYLFARANAQPGLTCLMGNHEAMMLRFLDNPQANAARWLAHGGLQTLASYDIRGISENTSGVAIVEARDMLRARLAPGQEAWLRALPDRWRSGNVAVVHAGADPAQSLEDQRGEHLIWGHPDFAASMRSDGLWIVHGHTIVPAPSAQNGRISIDTGAYATGRLSAAHISPGGVAFLTT